MMSVPYPDFANVNGDSTDFTPLIDECNKQIEWVMHIGDKD